MHNFRHFEFYGAILLPFKNCPMVVLISLAEFYFKLYFKNYGIKRKHFDKINTTGHENMYK